MQDALEKNRSEEEEESSIDRQNDKPSEILSNKEEIGRPEQEQIDPDTTFKDIIHLKSFHSSNSAEIARRLQK